MTTGLGLMNMLAHGAISMISVNTRKVSQIKCNPISTGNSMTIEPNIESFSCSRSIFIDILCMFSSGGDLPASSFDLILNDKKSYPYIPYAVILTRCSDLIRAG